MPNLGLTIFFHLQQPQHPVRIQQYPAWHHETVKHLFLPKSNQKHVFQTLVFMIGKVSFLTKFYVACNLADPTVDQETEKPGHQNENDLGDIFHNFLKFPVTNYKLNFAFSKKYLLLPTENFGQT